MEQSQYSLNNLPCNFTIMSWNILANAYVKSAYFPYANFSNLNYQNRIIKIKKFISQKKCDILCLQQVDFNQLFFNFLKQIGYQFISRLKDTQGIVIAYKPQLFTLIQKKIINFDDFISEKVNKQVYMRGHGAIIAKFKTHNNKEIIIANTHLFWDPKFQRVKYHQIGTMLSQIYSMIYPENSIILTGDLNSQSHSSVIQIIQTNQKPNVQKLMNPETNYQQMLDKYHQIQKRLFKLKSSYKQQDGYTNYTQDYKGRIDYIFYRQQYLNLVQIQKLPSQNSLSIQIALPNDQFPSDHLALIAKFRFKED